MRGVLVFDMDGVLVDVSDSYRETICRTVEHFTGEPLSRETIQDFKNQGGWNDDWALSHHIVTQRGVWVALQEVVDYFQNIFHGDGSNGLILRERWLGQAGLFERLGACWRLAVFTGRLKWEAEVTLRRFAPEIAFDPIVGMQEVERLKPDPEGLLAIAAMFPGQPLWYIGDTRDDAQCAAAAGVPFIGIANPAAPRRAELVAALQAEGARAVLDDINGLEDVLR
ncbi:MAG: HAD family hydrolase [Acidobacteria bacterium]|nr:MAG: HAD family hydrolase [Acidobacteriota bacterium]